MANKTITPVPVQVVNFPNDINSIPPNGIDFNFGESVSLAPCSKQAVLELPIVRQLIRRKVYCYASIDSASTAPLFAEIVFFLQNSRIGSLPVQIFTGGTRVLTVAPFTAISNASGTADAIVYSGAGNTLTGEVMPQVLPPNYMYLEADMIRLNIMVCQGVTAYRVFVACHSDSGGAFGNGTRTIKGSPATQQSPGIGQVSELPPIHPIVLGSPPINP